MSESYLALSIMGVSNGEGIQRTKIIRAEQYHTFPTKNL